MQRLIRLSILVILFGMFAMSEGFSQSTVYVSGSIAPGKVRIFCKDSLYVINKDYVVGGTLIIEPGTTIHFHPNGRLIDSTGGRIIADGYAKATYNANPGGNPVVDYEPLGYASFDYFFQGAVNQYNDGSNSSRTIKVETPKEPTVNLDKYNHIFHVLLDTAKREVVDLVSPNTVTNLARNSSFGSNKIIVSFEQALMFYNARLYRDPDNFDPNLKTLPWKRIGGKDINNVNVEPAKITFKGQAVTNFSREWGHIIVLPGARAAFFRNVAFENMRKDTTVDRRAIYDVTKMSNPTQWDAVNKRLNEITNGAGGALTTLSSRTWLLDVEFKANMARLRGGALNILQAPKEFDFTKPSSVTVGNYPSDKNPNLTNKDGSISSVNTATYNKIPRIDNIDEGTDIDPDGYLIGQAEPFGANNDVYRQALDDGRLAVYLGRMRGLKFENNYVQLANVKIEYTDPDRGIYRVFDDTDPNSPGASYPYGEYVGGAMGGAVYISGDNVSNRKIEVGFGINKSIMINDTVEVVFPSIDYFTATGNYVKNYQYNLSSMGARGGAIYIDRNTSLIVAGNFESNETEAIHYPYNKGEITERFSRGGAIFLSNNNARLQIRGVPSKSNDNPSHFTANSSSAGGAVYVDGNAADYDDDNIYKEGLIVGGSDTKIETRDYGFDIKFENNKAQIFGGAITTKRLMSINGSGGVEANTILGYDGKYPVRFWSNSAGLAGGALDVHIPSSGLLTNLRPNFINVIRAEFVNNVVGVGEILPGTVGQKRGGGAIYSLNGDLNVMKAVDFIGNTAYDGNGGAVSIISLANNNSKKYWVSDIDKIYESNRGYIDSCEYVNDPFTGKDQTYPADVRMLTRFIDNKVIFTDNDFALSQRGNHATQKGHYNRFNADTDYPENGIGLGGAIYILDSVSNTKVDRRDSIFFNRVRFQNNESFSGAVIYSDNYDLKLIMNRSLVTGNVAYSEVGEDQNVITGAYHKVGGQDDNIASSDLAGAIIYGEIQGPLPSFKYSEAANSIYNNNARFLIRLPDAPNSKGILAGTTGIGFGGTDTLRGNYWGKTEANVNLHVPHMQANPNFGEFTTFFVGSDGENWLPFLYRELTAVDPIDPRQQGPYESLERGDITYKPITLANDENDDTMADALSIPEHLLFSGHVYDMYDKGTDIKTADYTNRRMSPIEDFAVGIPPVLRRFNDNLQPSYNKYLKRWVRDPYVAELTDDGGNLVYPGIAAVQTEFQADEKGVNYHPIGYPLFLETHANYDGLTRISNHDPNLLNQTVFFVINLMTGDYVRANLNQVSEDAPYRETFRTTVELVPDSTNRQDPSWRRSSEGLANLGSGPDLLYKLYQNEYNEDAGALQGRRYSEHFRNFARVSNIFSNRPNMPESNDVGSLNMVTYFAGERYNALPVRVGDSVLVVSRTILWREGVHTAATEGLAFRITESTEPPVFTGDIVKLMTDTIYKQVPSKDNPNVKETVVITEFLNKVFVTEDREYPHDRGQYEVGRDSILNITAIDLNKLYDGRSFKQPSAYARLDYDWDLAGSPALTRWLYVKKKYAADPIKDGAEGYLELAGLPINPFVVPGGEDITVFASNYPPHYRTLDSLLSLDPPMDQDEIDKWIETYPEYFHTGRYDVENARFLQQDTLDFGSNHTKSYQFKIFVVNQPPIFLDEKSPVEDIYRLDNPNELYVRYEPSKLTCGRDKVDRLVANLTDKLRFQIDINTTDELEDHSPAAAGWDYRYGRTAYGFVNTALRDNPGDTTQLDSLDYQYPDTTITILSQSRPTWMSSSYFYKYDDESTRDEFAVDFTNFGQLNIRIDAAEAMALLSPDPQYNGAISEDTVFTVVANDGHGGIASQQYRVFINVAPKILNVDSIPFAVEDFDYNPSLIDSTRMIKVFDPNSGQKHTFRLIYADEPLNFIPIDPCYPEAGNIDLIGLKTTPDWLQINPNTGIMYGVPRVKDAPRDELITVVVTDEDGLSAVKQLELKVLGVPHDPYLSGIPAVECIDKDSRWTTDLVVTDTDLLRTNPQEVITIRLLDNLDQSFNGMTVSPSTYTGNGTTDNFVITVTKESGVDIQPDQDGKVTVKVVVSDNFGRADTLVFRLNVSLQTDFTATVTVTNSRGATQPLVFGTSGIQSASTGDGNDGFYVGKLDGELCEYELPPPPFDDVFDARWSINNRNGTLRNIFPRAIENQNRTYVYRAQFQAGDLRTGNQLYPVTISWRPDEVPARGDALRNPTGSSWMIKDRWSDGNLFIFNMSDPSIGYHSNAVSFEVVNGVATITVTDESIEGFVIMHDWLSSVKMDDNASATKITNVSPNPVSTSTTVKFEVLNTSYVNLDIVDMLGNVVANLANENMTSGSYSLDWDGTDTKGTKVVSGQYLVRLSAGNLTSTYPIMIVR